MPKTYLNQEQIHGLQNVVVLNWTERNTVHMLTDSPAAVPATRSLVVRYGFEAGGLTHLLISLS